MFKRIKLLTVLLSALVFASGFMVFSHNVHLFTITPSNPSSDSNFDDVVLLLDMEGTDASTTFTDQSNSAHTMTASGNAQIDTAQAKYGSASYLGDGTTDYIYAADSDDWAFGSGDWTIEAWIRPTGSFATAQPYLISQLSSGASDKSFVIYIDSSAHVNFFYSSDGTNWNASKVEGTTALSADTWYHIAVVNDGTDIHLFVDGVSEDSIGSVTLRNSGQVLAIGSRVGGTQSFNGWIDEVRITKGVARYPSGTTFTPPTASFPTSGIADGTILLFDSYTDVDDKSLDLHYADTDYVGTGWTEHSGNMDIQSNAANHSSSGMSLTGSNLDVGQSDVLVYSLVEFGTTANTVVEVDARWTDDDNYYKTDLWPASPQHRLSKKVGGTITVLDNSTTTLNTGEPYFLKLAVNGTSISSELDAGISTLSATDSSLTTGDKVAIGPSSTTANDIQYDFIKVIKGTTEVQPVVDTFTDTDTTALASHTPDTDTEAGGWTEDLGTWSVTSNTIRQTDLSTTSEALIDVGVEDMLVEADVTVNGTAGGQGVTARATDADNKYVAYGNPGTNTWFLRKKVGGTATTLASTSKTITAATSYNMKLLTVGDVQIATIDDGSKLYATDTAVPSGGTKAGLNDYHNSGTVVWDNFTVTNLGVKPSEIDDGVPLLVDNFTDTNSTSLDAHTPDLDYVGKGWVEAAGNWEIQSNNADIVSSVASEAVLDVEQSDVVLYSLHKLGTSASVGHVFRQADSNNYFTSQLSSTSNRFGTTKFTSGSGVWDQYNSFTPSNTEPYFIKTILNGSSITSELDGGVSSVSDTDTTHQTETNFGIMTNNAASQSDYIKVIKGATDVQPVVDTFTDADTTDLEAHTPDTDRVGGGWSHIVGGYTINSNAVKGDTNNGPTACIDTGTANYLIDVNLTMGSSGGGPSLGFRYQDINNYFIYQLLDASNLVRIGEYVSGSFNVRASTSKTISGSTSYNPKVISIDDQIIATIDDGSKLYYSSSNLNTETHVCLRDTLGGTTLATFNDYTVTEL